MTYQDDLRAIQFLFAGIFFFALAARLFLVTYGLTPFKQWFAKDTWFGVATILLVLALYVSSTSLAAALHYWEPSTSETVIKQIEDRVAGELPRHY